MTMNRRAVIFGLLGFAAAFTAPEAAGRGGRRAGFRLRGLPNGARHKGSGLTRDQLRQCVNEQKVINAGSGQVDRLQASISVDAAEISRLERQIAAQESLVNVYSQESVDQFNALVNRHRQMVTAYNDRLPAANARVEQMNAAVRRFNTECADRVYYESDMNAVVAGR